MSLLEIPKEYTYISAFLTMNCNLSCSFCLNEFDEDFSRKGQEISGEQWVNALNKIEPKKGVPITFCGGEPSLHKDFIYILNNLKPSLEMDILTNLQWSEKKIQKFIAEVDPNKIKRNSPYPSIRASYHPEQMNNGDKLLKNIQILQEKNFDVGIESVMYPEHKQLAAIEQMAIRCRNLGISFRPKSFTGKFEGLDNESNTFSIIYGNYSKYENAAFNSNKTLDCLCKTTELLIGANGNVYRCHRDLFSKEFSVGNITDAQFKIENKFKHCGKYGECHPCDVKVKTNYKQELGHTSVEIKDIK